MVSHNKGALFIPYFYLLFSLHAFSYCTLEHKNDPNNFFLLSKANYGVVHEAH